eukprot:1777573-Lingulodinium_polyedra.AAC.1
MPARAQCTPIRNLQTWRLQFANRTLAHSMRAPISWRAHGVRGRAINKPLRQRTVDSTAPLCN